MRTLNKNKTKLYYALYDGEVPIYDYYEDEDGNRIPIDTGETTIGYENPVEFYGNISLSGGESEAKEFGIDVSAYDSVLVMNKSALPIDETSLIWFESEPQYNADGTVDGKSADYTVVKVSPSLNVDKYVLKKVVK